jgi:hypothetical protein
LRWSLVVAQAKLEQLVSSDLSTLASWITGTEACATAPGFTVNF